jgi:hypothetical protein
MEKKGKKNLSLDYSNCHDVPLDAWVRRVSREVEHIFKKEGDLWPPLWFVETPERMILVGTPIPDREYKPKLAEAMTAYFQDVNARRYVAVAPVWMHDPDCSGPRNCQCDRKEAIHIVAYDGKQTMQAHCDIVRPRGVQVLSDQIRVWLDE